LHQGDVAFYTKKKNINSKKHEGRTIEREGGKLLLVALKFVRIGRFDRIPNY
jgi:ketosteroid isomerase-like protein